MKVIGMIVFVIGLIMTVYTALTYVTKEEVIQIGDVEVTQEEEHTVDWSPFVGAGVMAVGGSLVFLGWKSTPGTPRSS